MMGELVVLINGGSFSGTAILCACLKRDRRTLFIGEETGGNPSIISGDPAEFILPATKIKAEIATTTYKVSAGSNNGRELLPDYSIHPMIEEILAGNNPVKAFALKLVSARK